MPSSPRGPTLIFFRADKILGLHPQLSPLRPTLFIFGLLQDEPKRGGHNVHLPLIIITLLHRGVVNGGPWLRAKIIPAVLQRCYSGL